MSLDLYCLPHAGGDARMFAPWSRWLPADVRVVPVQRPGRGERVRERPQPDLGDAVNEVLAAVDADDRAGRSVVLFGHSLGAILAYEAARRLETDGRHRPVLLVVSGLRAPHLPARARAVHDLPEAEFVERLRELGGTAPSVLASPGFLRMMLPAIRADFAMAETYRYREAPGTLSCPIRVLGGQEDPDVGADDLSAWAGHTTADCTVDTFRGGHFFLTERPEETVATVAGQLRAVEV